MFVICRPTSCCTEKHGIISDTSIHNGLWEIGVPDNTGCIRNSFTKICNSVYLFSAVFAM